MNLRYSAGIWAEIHLHNSPVEAALGFNGKVFEHVYFSHQDHRICGS